jgi:hypothetical protein
VNRPFAAFGALAALASLAMFAVSSSNRSTTVQSELPAGRRNAQTQWRGRSYVLVLPAATSADGDRPSADRCTGEAAIFAGTCDMQRCVADDRNLWPKEEGADGRLTATKGCGPRAVRVEVSEGVANTRRASPDMECRSFYDLVYDRIVYGVGRVDTLSRRGSVEPGEFSSLDGEGELTSIFQSFIGPKSESGLLPRRQGPGLLDLRRLRLLVDSAGKWVAGQIARMGNWLHAAVGRGAVASNAAIDWGDYAELMNEADQPVVLTALPPGTSDMKKDVRSGDWLRHSAASSLYRLGTLIQAAALQLVDEGERPSAALSDSVSR